MKYDKRWIAKHSGKTTTRRMSAVLKRIADTLGRRAEDLAVTKVSKKRDPFAVLVATLISLRTKDEVTDVAAPRLLKRAPTPEKMARMQKRTIEKLIYPAGFYRNKAQTLKDVSQTLLDDYDGRVPATVDELTELKGVGRKTANLVVTLGHGKPGICVDIHVHRISNRLDYARTDDPDDTEQLLRSRLPRRWWIPINDLLVSWGREVCKPVSPHCSTCPVRDLCPQRHVDRFR